MWNDGQEKSNWQRVRQHSCYCTQLKPLILIYQCFPLCVCVYTYMHPRHPHARTRTHTKEPRERRRYSGLRYRLGNRGIVVKFLEGAKTCLFSEGSRPTLGPQGLLIGVSRGNVPRSKAVGMLTTNPSSSAKVKNNRRHISSDTHAFTVRTRKTLLHLIS